MLQQLGAAVDRERTFARRQRLDAGAEQAGEALGGDRLLDRCADRLEVGSVHGVVSLRCDAADATALRNRSAISALTFRMMSALMSARAMEEGALHGRDREAAEVARAAAVDAFLFEIAGEYVRPVPEGLGPQRGDGLGFRGELQQRRRDRAALPAGRSVHPAGELVAITEQPFGRRCGLDGPQAIRRDLRGIGERGLGDLLLAAGKVMIERAFRAAGQGDDIGGSRAVVAAQAEQFGGGADEPVALLVGVGAEFVRRLHGVGP